jgi:hypothetical protein
MKLYSITSVLAFLLLNSSSAFAIYTDCPTEYDQYGCSYVISESLTYSSSGTVVGPGNDAGGLITTAKEKFVAGDTTIIQGTLSAIDDEFDLYQFYWAGGKIAIETIASFDTMLFLFDENGFGIAGNDDNGTNNLSKLLIELLDAGDYFLAISHRATIFELAFSPLSNSGQIFPISHNESTSQMLPTGLGGNAPLNGWSVPLDPRNYLSGNGVPYIVVMSVPIPAPLALMVLGVVGIGFTRKLRA